MAYDPGYLDQVLDFLRRDDRTRSAAEERSASEDDETIEEPEIDDRNGSPMSLEQIFKTYEVESDPSPSNEALERLIPGPPSSAETFASFFSRLGVRNFSPSELLVLGGNNANGPCKGKNYIPAKRLWPRIGPTIVALDMIRERLGYPIRITNAYRSPEYNACLDTISEGVAKFSQHIEFRAIDFQASSGNPQAWHGEVMRLKGERPEFGIWTKSYRTFVHIDTRGAS